MNALNLLRTVLAEYNVRDIKQWSADDIYAAVSKKPIDFRVDGAHLRASAYDSPQAVLVSRPNTRSSGELLIMSTTSHDGILVIYRCLGMTGVRRLARIDVNRTSTHRGALQALTDILRWRTKYGQISDILFADVPLPDDAERPRSPEQVMQRRVRRPDLEHAARTYDGIQDDKGPDSFDFYQHHTRDGYDFSGKAFRRPAHASTPTPKVDVRDLSPVTAELIGRKPGQARTPEDLEKKINSHGGTLRVVQGPYTVFLTVSERDGAFAIAVMSPSRWGTQFCPSYMVRLHSHDYIMRSVNTDATLTRRVDVFRGFEQQMVDAAIKLADKAHTDLEEAYINDHIEEAEKAPAFQPSQAQRPTAVKPKPKPLHKLNDEELDRLLSQRAGYKHEKDYTVDLNLGNGKTFSQSPRRGVTLHKVDRHQMHAATKLEL